MYSPKEIYVRTSTQTDPLRGALSFLKKHGIGLYFNDERMTVNLAIEEVQFRNYRKGLTRHPKAVELRGLCAALLRRSPSLLHWLKIQPSYPEIARIIGYHSNWSTILAVKKYSSKLEEALAERHLI